MPYPKWNTAPIIDQVRKEAKLEALNEIRTALAGIRVSATGTHGMLIRRESVLDLVDKRRAALR